MRTTFYKYQGTGNDFIIIDNRHDIFDKNDTKQIENLCDRRFGIGADGLILLENDDTHDFRMIYYNADGNESTMCGNGGRCIVKFAQHIGIIEDKTSFMAIDGEHEATIHDELVSLQMQDVNEINKYDNHVFLDTGSPHHVEMTNNLKELDIKDLGSKIRHGYPYNKVGSNVNFVSQDSDDTFSVRTYERGVEDETLSCGTGVTAVALAMNFIGKSSSDLIHLKTPGGILKVSFEKTKNGFENIWLIGPATLVFKGEL